ncbi:zf-UBP-domain-containing protein [Annulohypoxylon moriforme]|nr:zf-UBP-domain-containing protein [Annulohypoxylon moriforme]
MPAYYYHIKFETYPTPTPTLTQQEKGKVPQPYEGPIWQPGGTSDIFDDLPSHSRPRKTAALHERKASYGPQRNQTPPIQAKVKQNVIDCGAPRPLEAQDDRNIIRLSERQHRQRTLSYPPPQSYLAINPQTAVKDWRFGQLRVESIDVDGYKNHGNMPTASAAAAAVGPSMGGAGKATKAKYVPLTASKNTELGWGIVHLYREEAESSELMISPEHIAEADEEQNGTQIDCTTVCIPAVPSYLSPSDFLGFMGDKWRDEVSHYRMVMTGRMNRYLVLMKFRESKLAQLFRREFDGKVFNNVEPETCTVAFVKSVTFESSAGPNGSFPDLSHDPFTPSTSATSNSLKPFPPPTPNLIELPTCPVCLERMDNTTGLLTIPCQHVFHCSCLQKWKGSGCPVCRHTNPTPSSSSSNAHMSTSYDPNNPYTQPFGSRVSNLCSVCDSPDDLWICLICGNVGCGRYKGGHAKEHWKDTAHTFSLELETQHIWDYAGDMWVHRLIRDKGDGKVVELPGRQGGSMRPEELEDQDVVPRAKLESIGMEYTHLLSSQLESQRIYFEEMLSKAADKAAQASTAAEKAAAQASQALKELKELKTEQHQLRTETIPALEKDLERERNRAVKSTDLARGLGKSLQEEKKVSEGLMKRIEHTNKELESLGEQVKALQLENADLKDQNHDLTMFISGQEKLKELEAEGKVEEGEVQEGSVSIPEDRRRRKGKGKGKS